MNVTIIGSGTFARKHAAIFSEIDDVVVTAFYSRTRERVEAACAELAGRSGRPVNAYTDLKEALDRERPDAAVIVVPPNAHGEIELELASRKVPFLVEKPIGIDADTPRRIAEAVDAAGIVTSAGFQMRHLDTVDTLSAMVQATTPVLANGYWMSRLPSPAWWRHLGESGGQFVEQTVHMVDLLRFLFGEADAVYAHTSRRVIHELHADADVPDAGAAVLHMANGMTATLVNSCIGPEPLRVGMEVVTPVALFEFAPGSLTVRREHETTVKRPGIDPYTAQDTAFVHAVRSGDRSGIRSDYADALRTHAVSMAIVESARSGSPVVM